MKGLLRLDGVRLVQKQKNDGADNGYWYNLAFVVESTQEIVQITAGVRADALEPFGLYNIGLNYINGKLKFADFEVSNIKK